MTDPIPFHAVPTAPSLAEIVTAQPMASGIIAFFLLYALLGLLLRLADRVDPPPQPMRRPGRDDPPPPRIWRFRKPA